MAASALAQQNGPKPAALSPSSLGPEKSLAFAIAHNGAGEVPGDGWHVKATFEVLTGAATLSYTSGEYEETWYASQNYKRTFTFKGVSHTDVATPDGLFRSGDQGWDTPAEATVRHLIVNPLPSDPLGPDITLRMQDAPFTKTVSLPCLFEVWKMPPAMPKKDEQDLIMRSPRICFEPSAPLVRSMAGLGGLGDTAFSKFANLHGHIVPQEITVQNGDVPILKIHVTQAEVAPPPTGPMAAPAGATKLTSPITVAWETVEQNRLPTPRQPVYPAGAIQEHLTGEVHIDVVISPDGTVTSAKIKDGIQMLRDSALEFIKASKFKPFLLSGVPAEVHTTAEIKYTVRMAMDQY